MDGALVPTIDSHHGWKWAPPPPPKSATSRCQPVPTRKAKELKKVLEKIHLERIGDSCLGLVSKTSHKWRVFPLETLHLWLSHWWVFKSQSLLIGGFKHFVTLPLFAQLATLLYHTLLF